MKLTVKEMREVIQEVVSEQKVLTEARRKMTILESRKVRINELLTEKDGILGKLGSMFGKVDPSHDVDDTGKVSKVIDKALGTASKIATGFQASAVNTTKAINQFHDSVVDALDKVTSMSDSLGADKAAEYQKKLVDLVRNFYSLLRNEADRIETFQKTIGRDLESKGLDKRLAYQNKDGLKNQKKPDAPAAKNPASKTFATDVAGPGASASKSFATDVKGPSSPSNKSFKTGVDDEE